MKHILTSIIAITAILPLSAGARHLDCDLNMKFAEEDYPPILRIDVGDQMSGEQRIFGHKLYFHVNSEGNHGYVVVSTSYPWTKPGANYICTISP